MKEEILVSVIVPCYNHGQFIKEAIQSIQTDIAHEIIIVDDGSTEIETLDILKELSNSYCVLTQKNRGVSAARNSGIEIAKGKYIIPLDADNLLTREIFEKGVTLLEQDLAIDVVYGDKLVFGGLQYFSRNRPFNLECFLYHHHIDTCALFRKTIWEKVNGYDEEMPFNTLEDWAFWLSVAELGGKFAYVPTTFFYYRFRRESKVRLLNSRSEVRLAMTKYLLVKKESVLSFGLREGMIQHVEAVQLQIKWRWALVYYAFKANSFQDIHGSIQFIKEKVGWAAGVRLLYGMVCNRLKSS